MFSHCRNPPIVRSAPPRSDGAAAHSARWVEGQVQLLQAKSAAALAKDKGQQQLLGKAGHKSGWRSAYRALGKGVPASSKLLENNMNEWNRINLGNYS